MEDTSKINIVPILWEYFGLLIITYLFASLFRWNITWIADCNIQDFEFYCKAYGLAICIHTIKITIKSNGR